MSIPSIILQQLGGRRFMFMTGAKDFLADDKSLIFAIGKNNRHWNKVKITLNAKDLYDVVFYRIRKFDVLSEGKVADVYAEDLQHIFTEYTGLYTRL